VNNTGETQEIVNIVGTFFDAEDNMIANPNDTSDFTPTDILPNGGSTPFELIVTSPTENVLNPDHYTLEVRSEPNSETPRIVPATDFTVQSQFTEFDEYCLTVNYQNTGGEFEEYLTLAAVLFDANGKVISLSDPYEPDLEEVAGGLVHEFDICIDPLGVDLTGARHEFRGWGR
jgi:hypothetical protein